MSFKNEETTFQEVTSDNSLATLRLGKRNPLPFYEIKDEPDKENLMPTVTLEEAKENRMSLIRKKKEAMQER